MPKQNPLKNRTFFVDSREYKRRNYYTRFARNNECNLSVEQLPYGDYVLGNTVIEYKTITDFCASIKDKRLKKESIKQANHYPYHYVLVVGDIDRGVKLFARYGNKKGGRTNFHLPNFYGALASLTLYTNVVYAQNTSQAFLLMKYLFIKCNNTNNHTVIPVSKISENPVYNFLGGARGVGENIAKNICDTYELTNLKELFKLTEEDLLKVELVGKSRVNAIMKAIHGDEYL